MSFFFYFVLLSVQFLSCHAAEQHEPQLYSDKHDHTRLIRTNSIAPDEWPAVLKTMQSTPPITVLNLRGQDLWVQRTAQLFFDALKGLSHLQELHLPGCVLMEEGAQDLSRVLSSLSLRVLNLSHTGLGPNGMRLVARALPHTLEDLNVGCNMIGPLGLRAFLGALPRMKKLKKLSLQGPLSPQEPGWGRSHSGNGFNDIMAPFVATLSGTSITWLDLSFNGLDPRALVALAHGLPQTSLETLHLDGALWDPVSVRSWVLAVHQTTSLTTLSLGNDHDVVQPLLKFSTSEKIISSHGNGLVPPHTIFWDSFWIHVAWRLGLIAVFPAQSALDHVE